MTNTRTYITLSRRGLPPSACTRSERRLSVFILFAMLSLTLFSIAQNASGSALQPEPSTTPATDPAPTTPTPAAASTDEDLVPPGTKVDPVPIGIEGRLIYRATGPQAASIMRSPAREDDELQLRIATVTPERDNAAYLYDLRYIARAPGWYDLRQYLQHVDGSEMTEGERALVKIISILPEDHDLSLNQFEGPNPGISSWYRVLIAAVGVLWAMPIIALIARKLRGQEPALIEPPATEPDLWAMLEPLLKQLATGELSIRQRARLEMLALGAWAKKLKIDLRQRRTAISALRNHPGAGKAVSMLERWLHSPSADLGALRTEAASVLIPPPEPPPPAPSMKLEFPPAPRGTPIDEFANNAAHASATNSTAPARSGGAH